MAGWHVGMRLARVSATTLLCPQGIVRSEAAVSRRHGRESSTGLVPAADVVPARGTVETTLPTTTRTIVVGLSPTTADADVNGFAMTLDGAVRDDVDPTVVNVGDRVYGLFAITADSEADAVVADVRTDERWGLAGVLGSVEDPGATADWILAGGLTRLRGLVTAPGGRAVARWNEPDDEEPT